jgi:hypothetical protein
LKKTALYFALLAALLAASRLCHAGLLWEGDALPLATAGQMLGGKAIYRDIWFDKPPLTALFYLLAAARSGWGLRLLDAAYALLCCLLAFGFARDLWSRREGIWAAGLVAFFQIFYLPAAVIPVASDLMMLAPHLAAVWMAHRRRGFLCGALLGVAFWTSPKAVFVAAACAVWFPAGIPPMAAGFAAVCAIACAWLWSCGALLPYWREVWQWGRLYAGGTFVASPVWNGVTRTLNWFGFHAAAAVAAGWFLFSKRAGAERAPRLRFAAWTVIALVGVAAGMRFFPRYYFLLLPPVALMAARGFETLGRARLLAAALLLIPMARFAPAYLTAARDAGGRDALMDRDSRAAAGLIRNAAVPSSTLLVWGYRPEIFPYSGLPAATIYLDCQPLTGVPADRHLTQSTPVEATLAHARREELARSRPEFIADGLSLFNPRLAITQYPELRAWFGGYTEISRTAYTVIYQRDTR